MKNFSTVGARLAVATLFAASVALPATAMECKFLPNAPDQHLVVKGDTLWGISGKFLEHPWCWPQVWNMNREEISNPHWIYPGQIVYFDRSKGRLSLHKPGEGDDGLPDPGITRLSPQLRTEGLGSNAIPGIPSGVIEPFLSQPLIVEADELKDAPQIVAAQEGHIYLGKDEKAYVAGELKDNTSFQVFRPSTPLHDPATGKIVAYEAFYLGTVKLVTPAKKAGEAHAFTVTSVKQEMGVGSLLRAAPPTPLQNYAPHQPRQKIDARVMSNYGGVGAAGQNSVISINRGSLDGLDMGSVLQLYHFGKTVDDPRENKGALSFQRKTVKLPDEEFGSVFVFRVFKHVSYGLIMQVREPVQIGDVAKSPE
ncbi:MAG: LysM peptidoglycan-binding domain-containing protein [Pseudomonadota bacterium]